MIRQWQVWMSTRMVIWYVVMVYDSVNKDCRGVGTPTITVVPQYWMKQRFMYVCVYTNKVTWYL